MFLLQVDLKGMKICYVEDDNGIFTSKVDPEIKDALRKAVKHLETSCGVKAEKVSQNFIFLIKFTFFFLNSVPPHF